MARTNAAGTPAATSDDVDDKGTDLETALDNELSQSIEDALDVDDDDLDDEDDLDDDDLEDDDDDVDDDEDDDDLDDDDDDEGDGAGAEGADAAAAAAPAKDGDAAAGAPAATGAAAAAAAAKPGEAKPGDAKAGETKTDAAKPAEGEPKWEPFSVNVDKQAVPIEEASIQRANGVVYIGMKEEAFSRFQQRISRGVVGERMWRDLQNGLKELEAKRSAPARKSDAEIEAALTYEALKPHLAEFLDDKDIQLLEAKIELAKANAAKEYDKAESDRMAKATETPWEEQQATLLDTAVREIAANNPNLGLTPDEIEDVLQKELLPVRGALITRDKDGTYGNTQYMFDRLKARASSRQTGAAAPAAAAAPSTTPAKAGNSSTTATSAADKRADRFNRGVDAAPRTTSLAARRGESRPANGATRRSGRRGGRKLTPQEQRERAEDRFRKKEREYLKSPGLDF